MLESVMSTFHRQPFRGVYGGRGRGGVGANTNASGPPSAHKLNTKCPRSYAEKGITISP